MTEALRILVWLLASFGIASYVVSQFRKPSGWLGKFITQLMNHSHSDLTEWALQHVEVGAQHVVLDVGCGGGRTIQRLAAVAVFGQVHGVDHSQASVATALGVNQASVQAGRVQVRLASVSNLPFTPATFDLVTAVETHYYWPDRAKDLREVCRVLKPGGHFILAAEAYRGRSFDAAYEVSMKLLRGAYLSPSEHRTWLEHAGLAEVKVIVEPSKGWLSATGRKPANPSFVSG